MLRFTTWTMTCVALILCVIMFASASCSPYCVWQGLSVRAVRGVVYVVQREPEASRYTWAWDPNRPGRWENQIGIPPFTQYYLDGNGNGQRPIPQIFFPSAPRYEARLSGFRLMVPIWQPALAAVILSGVLWLFHRRRPPPGHCRKCRYNLHGLTSAVCPECGTPVPPLKTSAQEDTTRQR